MKVLKERISVSRRQNKKMRGATKKNFMSNEKEDDKERHQSLPTSRSCKNIHQTICSVIFEQ